MIVQPVVLCWVGLLDHAQEDVALEVVGDGGEVAALVQAVHLGVHPVPQLREDLVARLKEHDVSLRALPFPCSTMFSITVFLSLNVVSYCFSRRCIRWRRESWRFPFGSRSRT